MKLTKKYPWKIEGRQRKRCILGRHSEPAKVYRGINPAHRELSPLSH